MIGKNAQLSNQAEILHKILCDNRLLYQIIEESQTLNLPEYYIGAGCIAQTVWNYQNGNPPLKGINDIDFVYFDCDLSLESENMVIQTIQNKFSDCPLKIDVKNQARVHLWYGNHFGYDIAPYNSIESAINTWPTTATSVGVRLMNNRFQVYAPFGLNDLFSQIVRPNKAKITKEIYDKKVQKWIQTWPSLTITSW
ncbi:MAG: nucleotidyltransferase family protein [Oscillospiraceae bacterium]|nr:nucleotidyltransferase family protein [Oscillospiraceae bacterium]